MEFELGHAKNPLEVSEGKTVLGSSAGGRGMPMPHAVGWSYGGSVNRTWRLGGSGARFSPELELLPLGGGTACGVAGSSGEGFELLNVNHLVPVPHADSARCKTVYGPSYSGNRWPSQRTRMWLAAWRESGMVTFSH